VTLCLAVAPCLAVDPAAPGRANGGPAPPLARVACVPAPPDSAALPEDSVAIARLRARDEAMFAALIDAWSPGMLRAARAFVADEHAAQDVVQETWLGVVRGIGGFEARSSLRTWAYQILVNRAKSRGLRDARTVPVGSMVTTEEDCGPTVDAGRFRGSDDPYPGHWRSPPLVWASPEDDAVAGETRRQLAAALAGLPARQRVVVTLRDVNGYTADEVCALLTITAGNQRVLLHRARAALRAALESYLTTGVTP
jgi:RNA polymerase sigma-70 factor, ECF subfamily